MSMCKTIVICLSFLITDLFPARLLAQGKYEKESRISAKDVPANALQFIQSLNPRQKVKWFKEEGLNTESFEAKFKHNNAKLSIEFDTSGTIEDIEMDVHWETLPLSWKDTALYYLKKNCQKNKIVKVQIQFTGKEADLLSKIKSIHATPPITVHYEVIVKCTQKKDIALFEYLFNDAGRPVSTSRIIFKNSSHLEY